MTTVDPLPPAFALRPELAIAESTENAQLMLPTRCTALITTSPLRTIPAPASHRTDVSDSHAVRSHAVLPTPIEAVYVVSPRPDPCTVTLDDPVAARLLRLDTLAMLSSAE